VCDAGFRKVDNNKLENTRRYVLPSAPVPVYPWNNDYVHVCRPVLMGPLIGRVKIWAGIVKHFFMVLFGLSTSNDKCHVVTNFSGLDGHELYNYAFSVRKDQDNLI
jgi:hypothetical protein